MTYPMHHLVLNAICEDCGRYGKSQCAQCNVESIRQQLVLENMEQPSSCPEEASPAPEETWPEYAFRDPQLNPNLQSA